MKSTKGIGPHGIDLTAPGGVEALLAFHRQTFGDARMEAGEGGDGGDGSGGTSTGGEGGTEQPPAGTTEQPPTPQRVEDLPDWAQRIITETRQEAANYRTRSEAAAEEARTGITQAIAQALGLAPAGEGEQPTVEGLTGQVQTLTQERDTAVADAREARVSLAAYQRSGHHNVDPAALLDSRTFLARAADLDPSSDTFQADLDDAIKAALKSNSRLLASQAGGSSSTDHGAAGGTGGPRPHLTLEQASANVLGRTG